MTHFTVAVALKKESQTELENKLQPYHEYECTNVDDQYVRHIDCHDDVLSEYKESSEKKEGKTLKQFVDDYYCFGESNLIDGRYHRYTNPNARWDWWVIGGRWSNFLLLKDGTRADYAQKKDIDIEGMEKEAEEKAVQLTEKYKEILGSTKLESWESIRDRMQCIDEARQVYHAQDKIDELIREIGYYHNFPMDTEGYIDERKRKAFVTRALVTDQWHEEGKTGWFGSCADKKEDWDKTFKKMWQEIPDDEYIVIVDCHI